MVTACLAGFEKCRSTSPWSPEAAALSPCTRRGGQRSGHSEGNSEGREGWKETPSLWGRRSLLGTAAGEAGRWHRSAEGTRPFAGGLAWVQSRACPPSSALPTGRTRAKRREGRPRRAWQSGERPAARTPRPHPVHLVTGRPPWGCASELYSSPRIPTN